MNYDDQFETIVSEHYKSLFKFAVSLTRSELDAQDLTQQTFYVWATRGHQLRDISKVKTWLFTTLHRAFLQVRRRQTRFPHYEVETVAEELPLQYSEFLNGIDSAQALFALAKVDEVYHAPVAPYYLDYHSYKDIAEVLEVPLGTVKSRIARGIAQLRKLLLSESSVVSTPAPATESSSKSNIAHGMPGGLPVCSPNLEKRKRLLRDYLGPMLSVRAAYLPSEKPCAVARS